MSTYLKYEKETADIATEYDVDAGLWATYKDYETIVKVNKKELLNCIDRVTLLIREGDKKPIIVQISDGEMRLKLTSGVGSMNEEIVIEKEGKDILIGFNPKFLMKAIAGSALEYRLTTAIFNTSFSTSETKLPSTIFGVQ